MFCSICGEMIAEDLLGVGINAAVHRLIRHDPVAQKVVTVVLGVAAASLLKRYWQ
jgi:hypothetical protein